MKQERPSGRKSLKRILLLVAAISLFAASTVLLTACSPERAAAPTTTAGPSGSAPAASVHPTGTDPSTPSPSPQASGGTTPTDGDTQRVVAGAEEQSVYLAQIPELTKALASDPDNRELLQQLAIAQYNTGAFEEAAQTYEKMLAQEDNGFTRNNYANVLRDAGKTEEAIANYQKAISLDENLPTPYVNLAALLAKEGKIKEALEILERGTTVGDPEAVGRMKSFAEQLRTLLKKSPK